MTDQASTTCSKIEEELRTLSSAVDNAKLPADNLKTKITDLADLVRSYEYFDPNTTLSQIQAGTASAQTLLQDSVKLLKSTKAVGDRLYALRLKLVELAPFSSVCENSLKYANSLSTRFTFLYSGIQANVEKIERDLLPKLNTTLPEKIRKREAAAGASGATGIATPSAINTPAATGSTGPILGATGPKPIAATGATAPAPTNPAATNPGQGDAQGLTSRTRDQAAVKNEVLFKNKKDWRVRLSLAPESKYLYNAPDSQGILAPLIPTNGVLFPYTPNISVQYNARYDSTPLTHTNYTFFNYSGSSVDQVMITCDFTAQDTQEANYLLAVIHFFRSATKMFFGNDENPKAGTPPPLCYLYGYGQFQFSAHPLVINGFTFSLPDDCDYIRADVGVRQTTVPNSVSKPVSSNTGNVSESRLSQGAQSGTGQTVVPGGNLSSTKLQDNKGFNSVVPSGTEDPTYVPTKIQLQISCLPIVSRYDVANKFSLKEYASGALLRGTGEGRTGGMW